MDNTQESGSKTLASQYIGPKVRIGEVIITQLTKRIDEDVERTITEVWDNNGGKIAEMDPRDLTVLSLKLRKHAKIQASEFLRHLFRIGVIVEPKKLKKGQGPMRTAEAEYDRFLEQQHSMDKCEQRG